MSLKVERDYWLVFRYIILLGAIVFFLFLFFLWRIDNHRAERFRLALLNQIVPNVEFFTSSVKVIGRIVLDISSFTNVYEQNQNLKNELQDMKKWREAAIQLEQKNAKLRALNNLKVNPVLDWVSGEVIVDSGGPYSSSALLNVGIEDGIIDGSAVVDGLGLVGRISGVEDQISRIILLSDTNSYVPVIIEPNNQEAIVRGDNSSAPIVDFIRGVEKIQPGFRIYTSGTGGVFPQGILIGKVVLSADKKIRVKLSANINKLDYLRILINREQKIPSEIGKIIKNIVN
ncbi:MAG: rod shape-determining protein MreC [Paracoccaceae bacterium]